MSNPCNGECLTQTCATAQDVAPQALEALQALGQRTRLSIFRLLVNQEPTGLAVGAIATAFDAPQNTISAHLAILERAKLVFGMRQGRSMIYRVDLGGMQWLLGYLMSDCCNGDPSACASVFQAIAPGPDDALNPAPPSVRPASQR